MLYEFIASHRDAIVRRTHERARRRPSGPMSSPNRRGGVPQFLTQLSETLRLEATDTPYPDEAIGSSATRHGAELLAGGFTLAQVVHDYGDICQVITALAVEKKAPIAVEEFHTMNRCLDTAIAEAITEHARLAARQASEHEVERLGRTAHDLRDLLNAARLAFHVLRSGTVAINGSTGAVLDRSLIGLQDQIDRMLAEVRVAAASQQRERLTVKTFVDEIAATGARHAQDQHIHFTVAPVDPALAIDADPQLLTSATMNLLHNGFKHTREGGAVCFRARAVGQRLLFEVEDECGGIPAGHGDLFQPFGERRGRNRSGLGLGLSIVRKVARAHNGDVHVRNLPGKGCVFTIDLPLARSAASAKARGQV